MFCKIIVAKCDQSKKENPGQLGRLGPHFTFIPEFQTDGKVTPQVPPACLL